MNDSVLLNNPVLRTAIMYASRGQRVYPVDAEGKALIKNPQRNATTKVSTLFDWFVRRWPSAQVATTGGAVPTAKTPDARAKAEAFLRGVFEGKRGIVPVPGPEIKQAAALQHISLSALYRTCRELGILMTDRGEQRRSSGKFSEGTWFWPEDPAVAREAALAPWLNYVGAPGSELRATFDSWQAHPKGGAHYAMDDLEYQIERWQESAAYNEYLDAHPPA